MSSGPGSCASECPALDLCAAQGRAFATAACNPNSDCQVQKDIHG